MPQVGYLAGARKSSNPRARCNNSNFRRVTRWIGIGNRREASSLNSRSVSGQAKQRIICVNCNVWRHRVQGPFQNANNGACSSLNRRPGLEEGRPPSFGGGLGKRDSLFFQFSREISQNPCSLTPALARAEIAVCRKLWKPSVNTCLPLPLTRSVAASRTTTAFPMSRRRCCSIHFAPRLFSYSRPGITARPTGCFGSAPRANNPPHQSGWEFRAACGSRLSCPFEGRNGAIDVPCPRGPRQPRRVHEPLRQEVR